MKLSLKDRIKTALAILTNRTVRLGHGTTTDPSVRLPHGAMASTKLLYALDERIGLFEVEKVLPMNGTQKILVLHRESGNRFLIPNHLFEFFFKEYTPPTLPLDFKIQTEDSARD